MMVRLKRSALSSSQLGKRQRAAFLETSCLLHRALGLRPWMTGPLDTVGHDDEPPSWMNEHARADWARAVELRRKLGGD
jgi:hypothetical protein